MQQPSALNYGKSCLVGLALNLLVAYWIPTAQSHQYMSGLSADKPLR